MHYTVKSISKNPRSNSLTLSFPKEVEIIIKANKKKEIFYKADWLISQMFIFF